MIWDYNPMIIPVRTVDTESFSLDRKNCVIKTAEKVNSTAEKIIKLMVEENLTFGQSRLVLELVDKELQKKANNVKVFLSR